MKTALVIPTLNAASSTDWNAALDCWAGQKTSPDLKWIVDSGSDDSTVGDAISRGWCVRKIRRRDFNHGTTRQTAVEELAKQGFDVVVFATQDAKPANRETLAHLLDALAGSGAAVAFSRQIPTRTDGMDAFFRQLNYPPRSMIKTEKDIVRMGIHAAFCSNVLSAWRIPAVMRYGGFPPTDFGEDMMLAARMLLGHEKICYCAESLCLHGHSDSFAALFTRGCAIGRLHGRHRWLRREFGSPEAGVGGRLGFRAAVRFFPWLCCKYSGFLAGYLWERLKTYPPAWLFPAALLAGFCLMLLNTIPANDTATRYAPMAEVFASGDPAGAFHPMYGVLFPAAGGSLAWLFGLNGFRACQLAGLLFWAAALFPLYAIFRKVWNKHVALVGCCFYLFCSHLPRFFYDGLRDNGRTFGLALLALGLLVFIRNRNSLAWLTVAVGGAVLTLLRADGFLFAVVGWLALFGFDFARNRLRCWRSIAAALLLAVLISPQVYLAWRWTGYPLVSSRHVRLLESIGLTLDGPRTEGGDRD